MEGVGEVAQLAFASWVIEAVGSWFNNMLIIYIINNGKNN